MRSSAAAAAFRPRTASWRALPGTATHRWEQQGQRDESRPRAAKRGNAYNTHQHAAAQAHSSTQQNAGKPP
jgi:hypothetical protein